MIGVMSLKGYYTPVILPFSRYFPVFLPRDGVKRPVRYNNTLSVPFRLPAKGREEGEKAMDEERREGTEFDLHDEDRAMPLCHECGMEVSPQYRFCPYCGSAMPESLRHPEHFEVHRVPQRTRVPNPVNERAEESYREFNAVTRTRRRKKKRRGRLLFLLILLFLLGILAVAAYRFFASPTEWKSEVIEQPGQNSAVVATPGDGGADGTFGQPGQADRDAPESTEPVQQDVPLAVQTPAAVHEPPSLEIGEPTRGVVVGSNVNVRQSHTLSSTTVGKVSTGNRVEVLEAWNSGENPEAVTLADLQVTGPKGEKKSVAKGRGVTVLSGPDAQGVVEVSLPEDKNGVRYRVPSSSLSSPQAWPWYRIKWQAKEGWIFGKFLAVMTLKEASLSDEYLRSVLHSFGATEEQLQSALGKPSKRTAKKSGAGSEVTLTYRNAVAVVYKEADRSEVRRLTLTSGGRALEGGLEVGMDRGAVLAILGYPNDVTKGYEYYRANDRQGLRIMYRDYRIQSMIVGPLS